jgi:hypothetical protein
VRDFVTSIGLVFMLLGDYCDVCVTRNCPRPAHVLNLAKSCGRANYDVVLWVASESLGAFLRPPLNVKLYLRTANHERRYDRKLSGREQSPELRYSRFAVDKE